MFLLNPSACSVCIMDPSMPMDLSMPKYLKIPEQLTNSSANSEKLLIKENENSDGNIKTLDEVVIMPMDLSMPKDLKTHEQLTNSSANVSVSEKPLIKHSMMRSDIITTTIRMKFIQYPFMGNLIDTPEQKKGQNS